MSFIILFLLSNGDVGPMEAEDMQEARDKRLIIFGVYTLYYVYGFLIKS